MSDNESGGSDEETLLICTACGHLLPKHLLEMKKNEWRCRNLTTCRTRHIGGVKPANKGARPVSRSGRREAIGRPPTNPQQPVDPRAESVSVSGEQFYKMRPGQVEEIINNMDARYEETPHAQLGEESADEMQEEDFYEREERLQLEQEEQMVREAAGALLMARPKSAAWSSAAPRQATTRITGAAIEVTEVDYQAMFTQGTTEIGSPTDETTPEGAVPVVDLEEERFNEMADDMMRDHERAAAARETVLAARRIKQELQEK